MGRGSLVARVLGLVVAHPAADLDPLLGAREIDRRRSAGGHFPVRADHAGLGFREPDERLRVVQLQQLAIQVIGEPDVTRVVDEFSEDRVQVRDAAPRREGLSRLLPEVFGRDPVRGVDVPPHVMGRNGVLDQEIALLLEELPLLSREPRRRLLVGWGLVCLPLCCPCRHGLPP